MAAVRTVGLRPLQRAVVAREHIGIAVIHPRRVAAAGGNRVRGRGRVGEEPEPGAGVSHARRAILQPSPTGILQVRALDVATDGPTAAARARC